MDQRIQTSSIEWRNRDIRVGQRQPGSEQVGALRYGFLVARISERAEEGTYETCYTGAQSGDIVIDASEEPTQHAGLGLLGLGRAVTSFRLQQRLSRRVLREGLVGLMSKKFVDCVLWKSYSYVPVIGLEEAFRDFGVVGIGDGLEVQNCFKRIIGHFKVYCNIFDIQILDLLKMGCCTIQKTIWTPTANWKIEGGGYFSSDIQRELEIGYIIDQRKLYIDYQNQKYLVNFEKMQIFKADSSEQVHDITRFNQNDIYLELDESTYKPLPIPNNYQKKFTININTHKIYVDMTTNIAKINHRTFKISTEQSCNHCDSKSSERKLFACPFLHFACLMCINYFQNYQCPKCQRRFINIEQFNPTQTVTYRSQGVSSPRRSTYQDIEIQTTLEPRQPFAEIQSSQGTKECQYCYANKPLSEFERSCPGKCICFECSDLLIFSDDTNGSCPFCHRLLEIPNKVQLNSI